MFIAMVKIKHIYIQAIVFLLFFIAVWLFWALAYPAHLHFAEELQCFEFTRSYFCDVIVKPAGLAEYIARYLVQFFYNGALGPVIIAALLTLVYHATSLLYKEDNPDGKHNWAGQVVRLSLSMVPALLCQAFLISLDAKITMPVALVICLYAVWLTEKIPARIRVIAGAFISIVLAFAVGSIFVVYLALVFLRLPFTREDVSFFGLKNKWADRIVLWVAALLLYGVILIALYRLYPYPKDVLTKGAYYNRFIFMPADFNISTWIWTIVVGFVMVRVRPKMYMYVAPIAILPCLYFAYKQYSPDEEAMLDSLYKVHNEQWDEILEKYSDGKKPASSYEQACLNLALAMKDQLADRYFTMPQYGVDGLLPVYQMEYMTPLFAADAYYQMGMINTAQRFYYESMESIADHQKSAWLLKRLTMTALANGRVNLAKRYIHKLKNTMYYSYWAEQIEKFADNPKLMDQNAALYRLRTERTKQESFFDDNNPPTYIAEMLNSNPNNQVAWQYLFTMLMTEGRLDELMQTAAFYGKHFPNKMLPIHVQEALLYHWVEKTGGLNNFPWRVSTEVGNRFMKFAQAAHQPRNVAEPIVRQDYGDTFWCYAIFKAQEAQQQNGAQPSTDASTGASQLQAGRE